jgi:hypothetical protein
MPYAPPVDLDTFYDEAALDYLHRVMAGHQWAIHLIGPDEIHYNVDFKKPEDDPDNPEFTQRTALKTAAELNAFVASQARPDEDPPLMYHAVVFHQGEPWLPSKEDGPAGEYCEWFDFDSFDRFCNICFEVIKDGAAHCQTCAPTRFPGLKRLECDTDPAHPALFMYADNLDGYGSPDCFYCALKYRDEMDAERRHARHLGWYRWRVTQRLLPGLKRLRLVRSWHWTSSATCDGCTSIRWRWTR